jgi:hypothetical protein
MKRGQPTNQLAHSLTECCLQHNNEDSSQPSREYQERISTPNPTLAQDREWRRHCRDRHKNLSIHHFRQSNKSSNRHYRKGKSIRCGRNWDFYSIVHAHTWSCRSPSESSGQHHIGELSSIKKNMTEDKFLRKKTPNRAAANNRTAYRIPGCY